MRHPATIGLLGALVVTGSLLPAAPGPVLHERLPSAAIALQDQDLRYGPIAAYRPWSDTATRQGDIVEYSLTANAGLHTDVPIGASPPRHGLAGGCGRPATGCWSARAAFQLRGANDPHSRYWQQRKLFTGNQGQVDLTWESLSPAQQTLLDAATAAAGHTGAWASDILNHARGERHHEQQYARLPGSTGLLRNRGSTPGEITTAAVYIGPPGEALHDEPGYAAFAAAHRQRPGRIAAGSGAGLLHVFDAVDGSEVYAYLPSMLLESIGKRARHATAPPVSTAVGGSLTVASIEAGGSGWRSILAGGGGSGFTGLYVLDVTEPAFTDDKLLFEKSAGAWGHVYGRPRIGRIATSSGNSAWTLFSGNGYHAAPGHPSALMLVDLATGSETVLTLPGNTGGLSAPVLLDTDGDDSVDLVFAGDTQGDLWMFAIDPLNPAGTDATRIYRGNPQRPLIHGPAIARHPDEPGYLVIFPASPRPGSGLSGTVHALWVDLSGPDVQHAGLPATDSDLLTRSLDELSSGAGRRVRIASDHKPVRYRCPDRLRPCPALHRGWRIVLPGCGERLTGTPFIRAGRVQFTTQAGDTQCTGTSHNTENWLMSLDISHGHDADQAVYDLNHDQVIDARDALQNTGRLTWPVGIQPGDGKLSVPVLVRVTADSDALLVNRLLPLAAVASPGGMMGPYGQSTGPPALPGNESVQTPVTRPGILDPVVLPARGPLGTDGRRSWMDSVY
ncbi:MAG: PilC/PilY family type IV pilus protein [Gammaproteobacteria bacterium]